MWDVGAFEAMNFISEWNNCASAEMSHVVGVLSVDIDLSLSSRIELLRSHEGVLEH